MSRVLLDFPWGIDDLLQPFSDALGVIRDFDAFLSASGFEAVPFVPASEEQRFWENPPRSGGGRFAPIFRLMSRLSCVATDGPKASPRNGPKDLTDHWRRCLRIELGDMSQWRFPQIAVAEQRIGEWRSSVHDDEVQLELEDLPSLEVKRVLFTIASYASEDHERYLEDYSRHKYAQADFDPWDVRHCHQLLPNGGLDHRCRLPKHPSLDRISLEQLEARVHPLRSENWPHEGQCWFVPPHFWQLHASVTKIEWRKGTFAHAEKNGRRGAVDYKGRVWAWHPEEGHWDVQLDDGGHFRVNSQGRIRE